MKNKQFSLRFLPLFEYDLNEAVEYIQYNLGNPDAAMRLIDDVESAILKRLDNPMSFEQYHSAKERKYPYYRIYVKNYIIFYVVIDDVMEVRRLVYNKRNTSSHI